MEKKVVKKNGKGAKEIRFELGQRFPDVYDRRLIRNSLAQRSISSKRHKLGVRVTPLINIDSKPDDNMVKIRGKKPRHSKLPKLPVQVIDHKKQERLTGAFFAADLISRDVNQDVQRIQHFVLKEIIRIDKDYEGETKEYLKQMLAYNVGQMILSIDYESLTLKTINLLFSQFETTFEEVKEAIRRDVLCQK
ncbi:MULTISPECIES: hypothetical protein [unclassified Paenibacillus]|uniref:hypothetical protein n=1 Tax=unclassified Paenibacillus TaxID=185978 RepID=UPI0024066546|nr:MULTISPECIES: hypothetical protein [unclassified Paenibacillus]